MSVITDMYGLYVLKDRFAYLAKKLDEQGYEMAAAELKREVDTLGRQLLQIHSVLDDYQVDIAAAQQVEDKPADKPRFVGVDMGLPDGDFTCFKGAGQ
tara:strand:- start:709 stop:1002 length:294 start_codon:yes stop_codon:yes gene_type:complete